MKKKILAFFTSFLLIIPVFTVPVKAEDVTYYWDGFYYAINTDTIYENLVNAYDSGQRFTFNYFPSGHALVSNGNNLYYIAYWLVDNESDRTSLKNNLRCMNVYCYSNHDSFSSISYNNNFYTRSITIDGTTYYYVYFQKNISPDYPVRNSHIPFIVKDTDVIDVGFEYCHGFSYDADMVVPDIYSNNVGHGMKLSQLLEFNNTFHSNEYFSQTIINLMSDDYYLPSGRPIDPNDPVIPTAEPTVEPTEEPTAEPTVEPTVEPSAPSSSSSSSQQQQQYQTISENAVNVTVTENNVITEETIQRLDQTLQNNNPYQTTFTTAVQTIDGFRQIGVKFAQTSEAFLDFLPSWVTDLLSLMFVLLFFFIVLRLLKVFHG